MEYTVTLLACIIHECTQLGIDPGQLVQEKRQLHVEDTFNLLLRIQMVSVLAVYRTTGKFLTGYSKIMMISSPISSPPSKRSRTEMPVQTPVEMPVAKTTPALQIRRLTEDAVVPTRGSVQSAGLDLYSSQDTWIPALGKCLVSTGISVALPDGCYGRVAPRSGLSSKHFVDVGAGVIDQDYRGEVKVLLFNFNRVDYNVKKGDRIAQLICERIFIPEVQVVEELSDTDRGANGFGSTGKN